MRTAAKKWALATGNPPLSKIDGSTLVLFRDFLAACRQLPGTRATADDHRALRQVQRSTFRGPPGPHVRDGLGLLDRVPWIRPPRVDQPAPEDRPLPTLVGGVRKGRGTLRIPEIPGIPPPDWWRALIVFTYNTGLRRRLFGLEWRDVHLRAAV